VLVPIEHLHPTGVSRTFAAAAARRRGWSADRLALLDAAFALYWSRTAELARRTHSWDPPRLRHIAVVREPLAVHPYAQLLNTSAWTLYDTDLEPAGSNPEFAAYLLAHGDRTALLGEVTAAALHNAAWWFDRSDAECARFSDAAAASTRPDAAAFRALAAALPWLRELREARLRPPPSPAYRALRDTQLFALPAQAGAVERLIADWTTSAHAAVATYIDAWSAPEQAVVAALTDWLRSAAPPLLVTRRGRMLWDSRPPGDLDALRAALAAASGTAVRDLHADLVVLDRHTRRFRASLVDATALPPPHDAEQRGYTYMHRARGVLAYDLEEPGVDRLHGPALPYARAMLGARAVHEWAHRAVAAGWVPLAVSAAAQAARHAALAAELDAVIAAAPENVRAAAADDLSALAASERLPAGAALTAVLVRRMSDFQANLLAARYLDPTELETYVRHNVRTLRGVYGPARLWRMLIRYLYEFQYLRFSSVPDRRTFFVRSTWFDADFFDTCVLDAARFDSLTAAVGAICDCYTVDESKFFTTEDHRGAQRTD
jgi:hypothetical protein